MMNLVLRPWFAVIMALAFFVGVSHGQETRLPMPAFLPMPVAEPKLEAHLPFVSDVVAALPACANGTCPLSRANEPMSFLPTSATWQAPVAANDCGCAACPLQASATTGTYAPMPAGPVRYQTVSYSTPVQAAPCPTCGGTGTVSVSYVNAAPRRRGLFAGLFEGRVRSGRGCGN